MNFKELLNDDDAVSPVIGVILMVAITVILAAVIGTFVLGLGDQVQTTAPNAQFQFDYDSSQQGNLTITHSGGDGINADEVFLSGDVVKNQSDSDGDGNIDAEDLSWGENTPHSGTLRAGDDTTVGGDSTASYADYEWNGGQSGAEISVVWQDADSDQSSTLRTWSES